MAKVLIVDDIPDNARLLSYCLTDEGYHVVTASNGPEALKLADKEYPDAILLDIMMPGMDGFEVLRRLKKNKRLQAIPVLLVSALDDEKDVVRGLDSGADDYVTKPFEKTIVVARTRSAVSRHRANLDRRRLLTELQQLATTDALTGLMNRRAFFDQFERDLKLARRHDTPLACAIVDLDFFKRVNDDYGHAVGDTALRMAAVRIKDACRSEDLVCRYGGEEFCVLLSHTSEEGAICWAERARKALSELQVPTGDSHISITGSIGVASRRDDTANSQQLTEMADQALLFAKGSGRNQVVSYCAIDKSSGAAGKNDLESQSPLHGIVARDVMTAPVLSVPINVTLGRAAELLLLSRLEAVPVVDLQGAVVGNLSEKDVIVACARRELNEPIRRRMTSNVVQFGEDASAQTVFDFFCRSNVRRVVVCRDKRPVGVISRATLLRYLSQWENGAFQQALPSAESETGKTGEPQRELLGDTAALLAKALESLREQIQLEADDVDANLAVVASRVEELTLDLLSAGSDVGSDPAAVSAVRAQPWTV